MHLSEMMENTRLEELSLPTLQNSLTAGYLLDPKPQLWVSVVPSHPFLPSLVAPSSHPELRTPGQRGPQ